jgi:hypothetical protein
MISLHLAALELCETLVRMVWPLGEAAVVTALTVSRTHRTKAQRMDKEEEQRADGKMSWRLRGVLFVRRETKVTVSKVEGDACR